MKAARFLPVLVAISDLCRITSWLPRHFVDCLSLRGSHNCRSRVGIAAGTVRYRQSRSNRVLRDRCICDRLSHRVCSRAGCGRSCVGIAISAALALTIGWPILVSADISWRWRLRDGDYRECPVFRMDWLTGGTPGIGGIVKLRLFGFVLIHLCASTIFVLGVAAICMLLARNLIRSRTDWRPAPCGICRMRYIVWQVNPRWLRTRVFILSAVLGSVAGSACLRNYGGFAKRAEFRRREDHQFSADPRCWRRHVAARCGRRRYSSSFMPGAVRGQFGASIDLGVALVGVVVLMPAGLTGALAGACWRRGAEEPNRSGHPEISACAASGIASAVFRS